MPDQRRDRRHLQRRRTHRPRRQHPAAAGYRVYIRCFTDPTMALLDLAARAGIAVAYLDRGAIEADTDRTLTDDEWGPPTS